VLVLAVAGIVAAGAALSRTTPAGARHARVLGLNDRELVLTVIGVVAAVFAGLAFGGAL
jgi:hypothetical protein